MTDPIADMITRIRNAGMTGKETVSMPYSRIKHDICTILEKEGFVGSCSKKGKKVAKSLEIELVYNGKNPRIQGTKRISKPSRRVYFKSTQIRKVKSGFGMLVLSTPKGVVSGEMAKKESVGGEALFEIW